MAKSTTKTIAQQTELNNRQVLQIRSTNAQQAGRLLTRITKFALGEDDIEMSPTQLRAAEISLRKSVPDLSAMAILDTEDHAGESREELQQRIAGLLEANPKLVEISGMMTAIALSKTVSTQEEEIIDAEYSSNLKGEVIQIDRDPK